MSAICCKGKNEKKDELRLHHTFIEKKRKNFQSSGFLSHTVTFLSFSSEHKVFFWNLLGFLTDMLTSSAEHLTSTGYEAQKHVYNQQEKPDIIPVMSMRA